MHDNVFDIGSVPVNIRCIFLCIASVTFFIVNILMIIADIQLYYRVLLQETVNVKLIHPNVFLNIVNIKLYYRVLLRETVNVKLNTPNVFQETPDV